MDRDLDKKIRHLQVEFITSTNHGWSYSSVLNAVIEAGLKDFGSKKPKKS